MTPDDQTPITDPATIAQLLLAQYSLAIALDRAGCPAVCAAIRALAGVRPEIPVRRVDQPALSRIV